MLRAPCGTALRPYFHRTYVRQAQAVKRAVRLRRNLPVLRGPQSPSKIPLTPVYPRRGGLDLRRPSQRAGLGHPPPGAGPPGGVAPASHRPSSSGRGILPTFHVACRGRLFYGPAALPVAVAPCMTLQKVTAADPHGSSMVIH